MANFYEERIIKYDSLPTEWKNSLPELEQFLQDNWDNRNSFFNDGETLKKQQFISFLAHSDIRTNNYIGTICFNGASINIFPKVFREEYCNNDASNQKVGHMIRNLIMWINYCNKTEYPFIKFDTEINDIADLRELFVNIFIKYVSEIISRNMFMKYENIVEDCSAIKGRLNINDYVFKKIPQAKFDKFQCEYSTFEYDNSLNRIIKYTCRMIFNSTIFENQVKLRNIIAKLSEVSDVKCSISDCDKIILNKNQLEYRVVLSLCKMFLQNHFSTFFLDNNDNFCFLFPTEVLFEGFIGGFISEILTDTASVSLQKSSDYLFENLFLGDETFGQFKYLRYDILVEFKDTKKIFILDTKYKLLTRINGNDNWKEQLLHELSSDDVYQVLEYANKNDLRDVYLLYPLIRKEDIEPNHPIGESYCQKGKTNVHIIKLPFIFEDDEEKMKNILKEELNKIFINK